MLSPTPSPFVLSAGVLQSRSQAAGAPAFVGAYDDIPSIVAAYGMRRLLTSYEGSLLRLRRSSDNAELDFGADVDGHLDVAAIATFVGAGSGLVTTWYDQSGSGYNAVQATAANQPLYVASGQNGRPVLRWDGSNDYINATFSLGLSARSILVVAKENSDVASAGLLTLRPSSGNDYNSDDGLSINSGNTGVSRQANVTGGAEAAYSITEAGTGALPISILIEVFGSNSGSLWRNSVLLGTDTLTTFGTSAGLLIGARYSLGVVDALYRLGGDIAELIICNVALSTANREAAEDAMNDYWGVY